MSQAVLPITNRHVHKAIRCVNEHIVTVCGVPRVTVISVAQATAGQGEASSGFDWRRQWYPVAIIRDLDAADVRKPHRFEVCGGG